MGEKSKSKPAALTAKQIREGIDEVMVPDKPLSKKQATEILSKEEKRLAQKTQKALNNLKHDLSAIDISAKGNLAKYRKLSEKYEEDLKELRDLKPDYFIAKDKLKIHLLKKFIAGINLGTLLSLEDKFEGTLLKVFTNAPEKIVKNKQYEVNFKGNRYALERVGFAQILPVAVRRIKVTDAWGNTRIGKRAANSPKGAFFDEQSGRYIEALDRYKFTALKTLSKKEETKMTEGMKPTNTEINKAVHELLFSYSKYPEQMPTTRIELVKQATDIVKAAKSVGIPASFVLALRRIENAKPGNEFGVKSVSGLGFKPQLMMALRHMQKGIKRYERKSKCKAFKGGIPTEGFIYYFSHYYAPTNTYSKAENKINSHHHGNLCKYYEKFSGKKIIKDKNGLATAKNIIDQGVTPREIIQSHEYMHNAPKFKRPNIENEHTKIGIPLGWKKCAYYISKLLGVTNPPIMGCRTLFAAAMNKKNGGKLVKKPANLRRLSLVFFSTYGRGMSHVALVYKEPSDNTIKILHHERNKKGRGIQISNMRSGNYYGKRFVCGVNLNY
ncbi:hypothetical protein KKG71_04505 [Patescibacteria group bacterium]|nr:hypothetical protein [Patescibacteria group bacterium]